MVFITRFECSFTSSPLISGVVLHLCHSFRVEFSAKLYHERGNFSKSVEILEPLLYESEGADKEEVRKNTLQTSGEDVTLHSQRVEKM